LEDVAGFHHGISESGTAAAQRVSRDRKSHPAQAGQGARAPQRRGAEDAGRDRQETTTTSRYRSTSSAQRLSDRSAAIAASAAIDPRYVSAAAARLALRDGNEVSSRDRRWTLPAVITRNKHPEALGGIRCLLTGGGLISVKFTFPLAQLLPCMPYSAYEDAATNQLV
jgi:hypothetical protein